MASFGVEGGRGELSAAGRRELARLRWLDKRLPCPVGHVVKMWAATVGHAVKDAKRKGATAGTSWRRAQARLWLESPEAVEALRRMMVPDGAWHRIKERRKDMEKLKEINRKKAKEAGW